MVSLTNYELIEKNSDIPLVLAEAEQCKYISLDSENSGGLDVLIPGVTLLLLQLEINGKAYLIDARKVDIELFRGLLESKRWIKVIQNANYDYKLLKHLRGIPIRGLYCTQVAEALLLSGISSKAPVSLAKLVKKYHQEEMDKDTRLTFAEHPYDEPFTEEQLQYAAGDVLVMPYIRSSQQRYLNQYKLNPIAELEFALIEPVAEMELTGIMLDTEKWRKSLDITKRKLFEISTELRQVLPDPPAPEPKPPRIKKDGTPYANTATPKPPPVLNIDSWQQLVNSFNEIGVDLNYFNTLTKKGPTNNATIKFALVAHSSDPVKAGALRNLLAYRDLNQVQKTFGDNLLEHVRDDGRIHAQFHPNGTDSGRFSSTNPNLQNIKKKGEEGRILRSCFIAAPGKKVIIADYSQIELRIAAELSGDEVMLKILSDPTGDIHTGTAASMFGVPYDKVDKALRKIAKTLNFGLIYGMGIKTLSERLDCSYDEAKAHFERYKATYSTLMTWLDVTGNEALRRGFTRTIGERIRWFPEVKRSDFDNQKDYNNRLEYFKRVGKNHPIQGTSADMTKTSIVLLHHPLLKLDAHLVNTIHDEICIEVPEENAVEAARLVKSKMITAGEVYVHEVPVLVDVKIRDCWWADEEEWGCEGDDENRQQLWLMPQGIGEE